MSVHSSAIIGPQVTIGQNVKIGPFTVIDGVVEIGDDVVIGSHVTIGTPPEIRGVNQDGSVAEAAPPLGVSIASDCVIREHVTIQRGSVRTTTVGRSTWLLAHSYLAHDVQVGEEVTVSAGARLAGHVTVHDLSNIGMNVSIHQRRVIGAGCMLGMGGAVTVDIPPLAKVMGVPARLVSLNTHLAKSMLDSDEAIHELSALYSNSSAEVLTELTNSSELSQNTHVANWLSCSPERPIKSVTP